LTLELIPSFILFLVMIMTVNELLLIGELASQAGISPDTLRHYERKGVIARPKRAANGYRLYPAETLERLRMVRRALDVGFTLDELARLFRERGKGNAPCREARVLAGAKLTDLEERLSEMIALRRQLQAIVEDWDNRLAETPKGGQARLLETIPNLPTAKKQKTSSSFASKNNKRGKNNDKS
jgi:DNA-binding transcriptional MerR regulator